MNATTILSAVLVCLGALLVAAGGSRLYLARRAF
jgi:hypothetical protein